LASFSRLSKSLVRNGNLNFKIRKVKTHFKFLFDNTNMI